MADFREAYGRLVREIWVDWAREQPGPKPSWLTRWDDEDLDDGQREVDMRIGSRVATQAVHDAGLEDARLRAQVFAWAAHMPAITRALRVAISEAPYEAGKKPYRAALAVLGGEERPFAADTGPVSATDRAAVARATGGGIRSREVQPAHEDDAEAGRA